MSGLIVVVKYDKWGEWLYWLSRRKGRLWLTVNWLVRMKWLIRVIVKVENRCK